MYFTQCLCDLELEDRANTSRDLAASTLGVSLETKLPCGQLIPNPLYFGQPSAGFFLDRDLFIRSFQFPSSFSLSAFGPGVAFFFLEWFELLTTFFLTTIPNIRLLCNWVFIHQSFSFGCFNRGDSSLAVIHLAIVPEKIKLP